MVKTMNMRITVDTDDRTAALVFDNPAGVGSLKKMGCGRMGGDGGYG